MKKDFNVWADSTGLCVNTDTNVTIKMDGGDVAKCFWGLSSRQQAQFFNSLGDLDSGAFAMQLQYIMDREELSDAGRRAMEQIGNYSNPV